MFIKLSEKGVTDGVVKREAGTGWGRNQTEVDALGKEGNCGV